MLLWNVINLCLRRQVLLMKTGGLDRYPISMVMVIKGWMDEMIILLVCFIFIALDMMLCLEEELIITFKYVYVTTFQI